MTDVSPTAAGPPDHHVESQLRDFSTGFSLPLDKVEAVRNLIELRHFEAGTWIFRHGEPSGSLFFLTYGQIDFLLEDNTGRPVLLERISAGRAFGEVSFFASSARTADARCPTEVFAFELERKNFELFLRRCPEVSTHLLGSMAHRLNRSSQQMREAYTDIESAVAAEESPTDRRMNWFARWFGTLGFLCTCIVVYGFLYLLCELFNKPTREDLSLTLHLLAIAISVFVLHSQSRDQRTMQILIQKTEARSKHLHSEIERVLRGLRSLGWVEKDEPKGCADPAEQKNGR